MNKAFTKEEDAPDEFRSRFAALPSGYRNLITPAGTAAWKAEAEVLRARLAGASEADAKTLKLQITDILQRVETHEVQEPPAAPHDRVRFGSTVTVREGSGDQRRYTLVGIDEADAEQGKVSWTSPLARALLNQKVDAFVQVHTPRGDTEFEILAIA